MLAVVNSHRNGNCCDSLLGEGGEAHSGSWGGTKVNRELFQGRKTAVGAGVIQVYGVRRIGKRGIGISGVSS